MARFQNGLLSSYFLFSDKGVLNACGWERYNQLGVNQGTNNLPNFNEVCFEDCQSEGVRISQADGGWDFSLAVSGKSI